MKCFVTGATGVLGRSAVRDLLDAGHDVRAVARDDAKAASLARRGRRSARAVDVFDGPALAAAVAGSDAILHLATNVPPLAKMSFPSAWSTHNRLRTEVTESLLAGAQAHGIDALREGVDHLHLSRPGRRVDRRVGAAGRGHQGAGAHARGRAARRGVQRRGRYGRGAALRAVLRPRQPLDRRGAEGWRACGPPLHRASAKGYLSSIHVEDAASAVVAALSAPAGVYNVVDDEPLTRREYADAFAAAFDLPHLRITPKAALRAVAGSSARALTASQRVSNKKFRDATGWAPAYRSAREGWAAIGAARTATVGGDAS